ncbi:MAG: sigma-54-dependent transcriptional regulator [Verrucomicrobiota bacterium]
MKPRVLIVEDDAKYAQKLAAALAGLFAVEICRSEKEFHRTFTIGRYDLLVVDMRLEKDREGLILLRETLTKDPLQPAIVITAYADIDTYAQALEAGALTYLDKKEFSPSLIARTVSALVREGRLRRKLNAVQREADAAQPIEIVGASEPIRKLRTQLNSIAGADSSPVLILGENGTGKELAAQNIHRLNAKRCDSPFLTVRPGLLSNEESADTEFFGKNSRRSDQAQAGRLGHAEGGVLLIKQADKLPAATLSSVLSATGHGSYVQTGTRSKVPCDVQLVLTCCTGMKREDAMRKMASDVNAALVEMPPLRDIVEDIPLLAQHFLQQFYRRGFALSRSLRSSVIDIFESISWKGNIKELKGMLQVAAIRASAAGSSEIAPEHIQPGLSESEEPLPLLALPTDYQRYLAKAEVAMVEAAIERLETTTKRKLAAQLGYNDRFTFSRRLKRALSTFPALSEEFPSVSEIFDTGNRGKGK